MNMEAFQPQVESLKQFLNEFSKHQCNEIGEDDALPYRIGSNFITVDEREAEIVDWVISYLTAHKAPHLLSCLLARETVTQALQWDVSDYVVSPLASSQQQTGDDDDDDATDILDDNDMTSDRIPLLDVSKLARDVYNKLHNVIKLWAHNVPAHFASLPQREPYCGISVSAIRNGRRKMEDRHVVLPYLTRLYPHLQGADEHQCFAAVYDGHGGTEAAMYASAHLHRHMISHVAFRDDPVTAMRNAYAATDRDFIAKCKRERIRSGSTAVTVLLRERKLHLAWLGDSQVLLVRNGRPVEVMKPHKPEREDERQRIEDAGGFVVMIGTWRVNATLSVSRAIGDADFKPIISGEPDAASVDLSGDEDYVILACDGLWDTLTYDEVVTESYNYLKLSTSSRANLASYLSQRAKEKGSTDNISVIVIFLREEISKPRLEEMVAPLVAEEDDQVAGSQGGGEWDSGSQGGASSQGEGSGPRTGSGHSPHGGATTHTQQQESDLFTNQSKLSIQSGNILKRLQYKSCHSGKSSNVHIFEADRVVEYKYYPKQIDFQAADEKQVLTSGQCPQESPVIPEHFVKAFQYARKFPAKHGQPAGGMSAAPSGPSHPTGDEDQENQSPNVSAAIESIKNQSQNVSAVTIESNKNQSSNASAAIESNKNSRTTRVVQKVYLEPENCSDTSNSELKLVTETGQKCVYARKGKARRHSRNKVKVDDARRASRERLSQGIAERTKMSSNSSSSPIPTSAAKKSVGSSSRNYYGWISTGREDLQVHGEGTAMCRSNWTVAVEIENAASMFGD